MTLNLKRKAAIEDLFDRYCQRGDVDTITVSTIPVTSTGIQLLISCPSMHGIQRTHEALHNSITLGLNPKTSENNNNNNNNENIIKNNNNDGDKDGNNNENNNGNATSKDGNGNNNNDNNNNNLHDINNKQDDNVTSNNNSAEDNNNNNNSTKRQHRQMLVHNQGETGDDAAAILHSASSGYNLADPNGETDDERREKHTVRCGVETILQLAKFKQASVDASVNSTVMITSQYSNFLLNQFISGPLLITLSAKRREGRSLGLLVALANEIKAEPVFKQFIEAAIETRLNG